MHSQSVHFRSLMAAVSLLSLGSLPLAANASGENLTTGLKPVASFDFGNAANLGRDVAAHDRQSAVLGTVRQADSPFGCAAVFDGKSRISVNADGLPDFSHGFSATAWIDGVGARYRTMELAGMRSPNFQVVGDRVYFVTNSDPVVDTYDQPKKGKLYWGSAIWSGVADANLGAWNDKQRTESPLSGLEPKLQVVGDRIYFQYFGNSADGAWQIYTGTSGTEGKDWHATQRTFTTGRYETEQTRNVQVVGDKVYYAFPMKDKAGKWQLWTATSNLDGSAWKARQQTTSGGIIPSFKVSGDKIYYIFPVHTSKKERIYDIVIASANLDGSGWHEIRRVHGGAWWIIAQLTVDKGTIYFSYSKGDPNKSVHLWTGRVETDGSDFQERQRTFGIGNSIPAGVQVVGSKVMYSFSVMQRSMASMKKIGKKGFAFWTASTDLSGDNWVQQRHVGGDGDDHLTGYKMLSVVGGKSYYDVNRLHYVKKEGHLTQQENGVLAYSGSNVLSKGDSYGIGMSASGSVSGFVNAGEDYLYRGEAPEDTAGAMVEQKLAPGWHHVAATYNGNILLLYVDGKLTRETKYGKKPAANPFPLSIGDGFVGKIARVTLFDRALDPSEISILADRRDEASCRPAPR